MFQSVLDRLIKPRSHPTWLEEAPNALEWVHLLAKGYYKGLGYKWELREFGDLKIGFWKKVLRKKDSRKAYPKRFVLMPGFGDTPISWQTVISLLSKPLRENYDEVILFDFPGFGGFLTREKAFPNVDLMISAVSDVLDSLKPHTVMGHSLGGYLASTYASLCGKGTRPTSNRLNYAGPQLLILANPSGIYPDEETTRHFETMIKKFVQAGNPELKTLERNGDFSATLPESGFTHLRPRLFAKEPKWFFLFASHFNRFLAREDIHQFVNSAKDEHALYDFAGHIEARTFILWGEKDTLVPASCVERWLACLKTNETAPPMAVLMRDSGHSPHLENPLGTTKALREMIVGKSFPRTSKHWWTETVN